MKHWQGDLKVWRQDDGYVVDCARCKAPVAGCFALILENVEIQGDEPDRIFADRYTSDKRDPL